jgi:hypothetical protein
MKNLSKIFVSILLILIIWSTYVFLNFPNIEKIKEKLKDNYSENLTPDKNNIEKLIKLDKENNRTILLGKAESSRMYKNWFPYSTHKFGKNETERILQILNDESNYIWGEIGTPYYDQIIVFFDKEENEIGYMNISLDGQIDVFPNIALTKWGCLSDKGFRELVIAIRTE